MRTRVALVLAGLAWVASLVVLGLRSKSSKPADPCAPLEAWRPIYRGDGRVVGLVCYSVKPPRVLVFR